MMMRRNVKVPRDRLESLMATGMVSGFVTALVSVAGMPVERAEAESFAFRDALFRNWDTVTELLEMFLDAPPVNSEAVIDMGVIR